MSSLNIFLKKYEHLFLQRQILFLKRSQIIIDMNYSVELNVLNEENEGILKCNIPVYTENPSTKYEFLQYCTVSLEMITIPISDKKILNFMIDNIRSVLTNGNNFYSYYCNLRPMEKINLLEYFSNNNIFMTMSITRSSYLFMNVVDERLLLIKSKCKKDAKKMILYEKGLIYTRELTNKLCYTRNYYGDVKFKFMC